MAATETVRPVLETGLELVECLAESMRTRARGSRAQRRIAELTGEDAARVRQLDGEAGACFRAAEMLDAVLAAARRAPTVAP